MIDKEKHEEFLAKNRNDGQALTFQVVRLDVLEHEWKLDSNVSQMFVLNAIKKLLIILPDGSYVAGGVWKDLFMGKKPKDIDIYFCDVTTFKEADGIFMSHVMFDGCCNFDFYCEGENKYVKNWVMNFSEDDDDCYMAGTFNVQLIKQIYGTQEEILKTFDFDVCKFLAYKTHIGRIRQDILMCEYSEFFFNDLMKRELNLRFDTIDYSSTITRMYRYIRYGFKPSAELLRMVSGIDDVPIGLFYNDFSIYGDGE